MTADMSNGMNRTPRKPSRERGTALIEFALVLPLLLVLTVAAIDFGRAFYAKNMLHQAAREGVRQLVVSTAADSTDIIGRVIEVAKTGGITVTNVKLSGPVDRQMRVHVEAEFNWNFPGLFNLFGANFTNPMTMAADAVMRQET